MTENIRKTAAFIKDKLLAENNDDRFDWPYRYEHSLRVAGIGQKIAREEGLDEEALVIACLLHDIGYIACHCKEDHDVHGRFSALIAKKFLTSIGLEPERIETICYGIKIHTEPEENYERTPTPFEVSIGDADDIDRFDAYRLYSYLHHSCKMHDMTAMQILETAEQRLVRCEEYMKRECGTKAATLLWRERIGFQLEYFKRLRTQMGNMKLFCEEFELS